MNQITWNKRKATIAIALCTIIAVSSIIFLQNNQTTQAALINPHPGLVGWWSFDEGSGTVAGDNSGNGNNGTIFGATRVAGKYGNALSFDGLSSYVDLASSAILMSSPITVSAWVKTSTNSGLQDIYRWRSYGVELGLSNGIPFFTIYNSASNGYTVTAPQNIADGTFHQIVGVYDGTHIYIYIDGNLRASNNAGVLYYGSGSASIGRAGNYNGIYFNGVIDDVHLYNRALSSTEVQAGFQQNPDFSPYILAKVPMGVTQVIATLSWQGTASINVTVVSPSQTYTESTVPVYQKTTYSTSDGMTNMLNIKRLSISVNALPSDQNWNVTLVFDNSVPYQLTVEVQK
jgi:hypothetical protein